jgi:hypothetical protein
VRESLQKLNKLAQRESFGLLIAAFPFESQVSESEAASPQELMRAFQSESGVPVVDLLPSFRQAATRGERLFLDDPTRHPSPQGHAVAAQELYRFMAGHGLLPICAPDSGPSRNLTAKSGA